MNHSAPKTHKSAIVQNVKSTPKLFSLRQPGKFQKLKSMLDWLFDSNRYLCSLTSNLSLHSTHRVSLFKNEKFHRKIYPSLDHCANAAIEKANL